jgi:hypothetical protein
MSRKERDGYYKAGHAVVALRESLEVVQVSVQEEDGALKGSMAARSEAKSVMPSPVIKKLAG